MHYSIDLTLFGAPRIALEELDLLEKQTPSLVAYAVPVVIILSFIEFVIMRQTEKRSHHSAETLGSSLVGVGNLVVNLLIKTALLFVLVLIYNLLPWRMELVWYTLIPCFILYDFCSYWSHRISHINRFFWASHVVHHSADHFNLTVSFRQSWLQHVKIVFFVPLAFAGFHPVIFMVVSQLSTLYQFWVHTESISTLHPWIEKYFGTPSNHRVHHGSQEKYIDKNFGATLMLWDHLFGTFQYEEEPPVYGLTSPLANRSNPFYLNFHEYGALLKDVKRANNWKEAYFYVFANPAKIARYKHLKSIRETFLKKQKRRFLSRSFLILWLAICLLSFPVQAERSFNNANTVFFIRQMPEDKLSAYALPRSYKGELSIQPFVQYTVKNSRRSAKWQLNNTGVPFFEWKVVDSQWIELQFPAWIGGRFFLRYDSSHNYQLYLKEEEVLTRVKTMYLWPQGVDGRRIRSVYYQLIPVNSEQGKKLVHTNFR